MYTNLQFRTIIPNQINCAAVFWKLVSSGVYWRFGDTFCLHLQGKSAIFYHRRQWQHIVRKSVHVRINGVTSLRTIACSVTWHSRGKWSSSAHLTICRIIITIISYTLMLYDCFLRNPTTSFRCCSERRKKQEWKITTGLKNWTWNHVIRIFEVQN
jgi:hypothetical protein